MFTFETQLAEKKMPCDFVGATCILALKNKRNNVNVQSAEVAEKPLNSKKKGL